MAKGDRLNLRQEAFCIALAVDGLSQRGAYIKAYGEKSATAGDIDRRACLLAQNTKVIQRLAELRDKLVETAIWSKADMINSLKRIAGDCEGADIVTIVGENIMQKKDSAARGVAVKAIDTASKMLGYNAAEKIDVDTSITVVFDIPRPKAGVKNGD